MQTSSASRNATAEQQNKDHERRLIMEGFSKGDLSVISELIASDAVDHTAPPGLAPGLEGVKQFIAMFRAAFPDLTYTIHDQIADGDKVVTRSTWSATHKGTFMGIPASGKTVSVNGIDITRYSGGKAVEHWAVQDIFGLMQQIGGIPSK